MGKTAGYNSIFAKILNLLHYLINEKNQNA